MDASDVGALEKLFSQGRGDAVEIRYDNEERRFVATLWEDCDPDEGDLEGPGDDELSPVGHELLEYGDEEPILRELASASGETMVEALLQLELAYRNLIGARR